jgi:hypothetical protein
MVAAAATAQAAPMLPQAGDLPPVAPKPAETAQGTQETEPVKASHDDDFEMSSQRRRYRRRRGFWRPRRRRILRRRRRVIYY